MKIFSHFFRAAALLLVLSSSGALGAGLAFGEYSGQIAARIKGCDYLMFYVAERKTWGVARYLGGYDPIKATTLVGDYFSTSPQTFYSTYVIDGKTEKRETTMSVVYRSASSGSAISHLQYRCPQ